MAHAIVDLDFGPYRRYARILPKSNFVKLAEKAIRVWGCEVLPVLCDISFVDRKEIMRLNRLLRGNERVTDVLSYACNIIICIPEAIEQAAANKRTLKEEVKLLFTHGLLHLFGMEHKTTAQKRNMWAKQDVILGKKFRYKI